MLFHTNLSKSSNMKAGESITSISSFLRSQVFRFGIYTVLVCVAFESIYAGTCAMGPHFMGGENGPVELSQVVLAVLASAGLLTAAFISPAGRSALIACGALLAYAAARESDQFFESVFFDDAYKWIVGLPAAIVVVAVVMANPRRMISDVMWLMRFPAATMFSVAAVFLCFVCQVFDRPEMWTAPGMVGDTTTTKALFEESCELFAYMLIAFSAVESVFFARQCAAEEADNATDQQEAEVYPIAA